MSTPDVRVTRGDTNDTFPYSGTRVLGAVQINIGILVFVLGIVDLILTMSTHSSDRQKYGSRYETVVSMTVVSSPLWCGLWYSIAGGLGACLTRDRASTVVYCKIACLVINILCCGLFGPVCAVITGYISYTRHNLARDDYQWLISLMVCFLAVIQVILSTVSASVTCCCSTVRSTQVHVFVNSRGKLRETENQQHSNRKSSYSPSHVDISNISHNNVKNNSSSNEIDENLHSKSGNSSTLEAIDNHHNSRKNSSPSNEIINSHNSRSNLSTKEMRANTPLIPSHIFDRQAAVNNENDYTKPARASLQEEEEEKDNQYSASYLALKKWALPRQ